LIDSLEEVRNHIRVFRKSFIKHNVERFKLNKFELRSEEYDMNRNFIRFVANVQHIPTFVRITAGTSNVGYEFL